MNMLATIVPKSDQINADDLIGRSLTITITEVKFSGGTEQPVSMYFDGSDKAYRPCKSMCRVLVANWGPDAKNYVGRSLTLYRDPKVKWGGLEVGGIRISHMSHIESSVTMALTTTRSNRAPFTVRPLADPPKAQPAAQIPTDKRGKAVAWIDWYENELGAATDQAALGAVHAKAKPTAERIRREFPDLYEARLSAMLPGQPDDFAIPASTAPGTPAEAGSSNGTGEVAAFVPEGPDDSDRGEAITLQQALDEIAAAKDVPTVNRLVAAHKAALPDDEDAIMTAGGDRCDVLLREKA